MKRVLVPLAPGFEEIEAITIVDVLRRAGVTVDVAGTEPGPITGSHGITVAPDRTLAGVDAGAYDLVALPGGMPGTLHLREHPEVRRIVRHLAERGRYTTAICAAPTVLAAAGVTAGRALTSHPSVARELAGAAYRRMRWSPTGPSSRAAARGRRWSSRSPWSRRWSTARPQSGCASTWWCRQPRVESTAGKN